MILHDTNRQNVFKPDRINQCNTLGCPFFVGIMVRDPRVVFRVHQASEARSWRAQTCMIAQVSLRPVAPAVVVALVFRWFFCLASFVLPLLAHSRVSPCLQAYFATTEKDNKFGVVLKVAGPRTCCVTSVGWRERALVRDTGLMRLSLCVCVVAHSRHRRKNERCRHV